MTASENDFYSWQRARAKLLEIMETHQPQALPPDVQQEMDALLKAAGASANVS